jgi:hypothetical protein
VVTTGYQTQFHNDWQVNFNFSGETDGGLSFGGKVQIEENNTSSRINGTPKHRRRSLLGFGFVRQGDPG